MKLLYLWFCSIDDFKPASVDKQKMGTVEVEGNHQVTVTVPHVEGSGTSQTVFKGNHKPVAKECILIIDHVTGEIVLERISQAISVKTTRWVVTNVNSIRCYSFVFQRPSQICLLHS